MPRQRSPKHAPRQNRPIGFKWHSPLAYLVPCPRITKKQISPRRVVVHITGTSTYINAASRGLPPLDYLYKKHFGVRGHVFAHYTVDPWGRIYQYASEQHRSWAQGWSGRYGTYQQLLTSLQSGERVPPEWWLRIWNPTLRELAVLGFPRFKRRRVPHTRTPLDLIVPATSPNTRTVSIEFIQYQPGPVLRWELGTSRYKKVHRRLSHNRKLTFAQYSAGGALIKDICFRHAIPLLKGFILGHEDIDPWGRGTPSGGWDPGAHRKVPRFSWEEMLGQIPPQIPSSTRKNICLPTPPIPPWARMDRSDP